MIDTLLTSISSPGSDSYRPGFGRSKRWLRLARSRLFAVETDAATGHKYYADVTYRNLT